MGNLEQDVAKMYRTGASLRVIGNTLGINSVKLHGICKELRKSGEIGYRVGPERREMLAKASAKGRESLKRKRESVGLPKLPVQRLPEYEHSLRLRPNLTVKMTLPTDLNHSEVDRIGYWLRSVVIE